MRSVDSKKIESISRKWSPIVNKYFNYKNEFIIKILCLYCEWYSSDSLTVEDLPMSLSIIKDKIDSFSKIEIINECLNPISGNKYYKLTDGGIIDNKTLYFEPSDNELIDILGSEFIRDLDVEKYRDNEISKII